jgi:hypothetical protein
LLASRHFVVVVVAGDGAPADDAGIVGVVSTIYHHLTYANRYGIFHIWWRQIGRKKSRRSIFHEIIQ